jgi:hypothetical protein
MTKITHDRQGPALHVTVRFKFPSKKLFRGRRNRRNKWVFVPTEFRLFRGTENSQNFVPNHFAEEKKERHSKLTLPWTSECLGMSTFFNGITATVPSLIRGIISE